MLNGVEENLATVYQNKSNEEKGMVRCYMHRPLTVDIRLSVLSCPYCLDDNGVGQNSVCDDVYIEVTMALVIAMLAQAEDDCDGEDIVDDDASEDVEGDGATMRGSGFFMHGSHVHPTSLDKHCIT